MTAAQAALAPSGGDQFWGRLEQSSSAQVQLLLELLAALDWKGESRQLRNALCGSPEQMDRVDLFNTLSNLGYRWTVKSVGPRQLASLGAGPFPLLLELPDAQGRLLLLRRAEDLPPAGQINGRVHAYRFILNPSSGGRRDGRWYQAQLLRFSPMIWRLYLISLFINLLALILPYYVRAVYNVEIPGQQAADMFRLLPFALGGVGLQMWLTHRRQLQLATLGAQLDLIVSLRALEQILLMRLPQLERYLPLTLATRLRSFQGLRYFTTGPAALALLDLPYVVVFLAALASISASLALLTVVVVLLCMGGIWVVSLSGAAINQTLRSGSSDLERIQLDLLQHLPRIKHQGEERIWQARFEGASAQSTKQSLATYRLQELVTILTGEFSQLTGVLVLAAGAALALQGEGIELGTLLAAMFFVWRVFRPFQLLFQSLIRWQQVSPSLDQLNRLMASSEVEPAPAITQPWLIQKFVGGLELVNVSLRLNDLLEPSLSAVNLRIQPGELVVIGGPEGSGRSVLLKLLEGHYRPGSGKVLLDGCDQRQIPLSQLRSAVGRVGENPRLFPGTLRENLLLGNPSATDLQMGAILERLALESLLDGEGLDRRFAPTKGQAEISMDLIYGISLARVLLSTPAILLLDEPMLWLREPQRRALLSLLQALRGSTTCLVTGDDPELMAQADRLVVLRAGVVAFQGTPAELLAARGAP